MEHESTPPRPGAWHAGQLSGFLVERMPTASAPASYEWHTPQTVVNVRHDSIVQRLRFVLLAIIASMNSKHTKTLAAVCARPTPVTLEWARIESLLIDVGCTVIEGNGSRVRFVHGTTIAAFHRPHPAKEAKAYQVDDARAFLTLIGVTP